MQRLHCLAFAATSLALVAGCPDPKGQLDDFSNRVIDASPTDLPDGATFDELPDITGSFYITLEPSFAAGSFLSFIWDNTLTIAQDQTGTLALVHQALTFDTRVLVGPVTNKSAIPVSNAGQFVVQFTDLLVVGEANPITMSEITATFSMAVTIVDENGFCGVLTEGVTSSGIDLAGSKFVGRRVAAGTSGDALPDPTSDCATIEPTTIDAGPVEIDAGLPDAT